MVRTLYLHHSYTTGVMLGTYLPTRYLSYTRGTTKYSLKRIYEGLGEISRRGTRLWTEKNYIVPYLIGSFLYHQVFCINLQAVNHSCS